ncbi:nuclear transport factor 2 family protein [Noviherbaspirillum sp. CPCC 100848]|uniref:Nuclear transport factor 2 family protein n=1 Tax=Noviherbaspirillum album TaxID=3080276 RepID=A0ABU6J1Z6_9BURK|nr:nuclear transport factor 2 family protein [Noviherbaspirillum sp. CPCC 100848]MEC4717632.1 nuclear transport factor 2 family protein [Noviherbaspirillum sp. CPCC 100848]
MDVQQARHLADRFIEQLHRLEDGDPQVAEQIADMFADGAQLSNPVLEREHGIRQGRGEIAEFWRQYASAFGEIHSEFYDVTTSDHSAGLFWKSTGKSPSGEALSYDGVSLLAFDDEGKIARFQGFYDTRQLTLKESSH